MKSSNAIGQEVPFCLCKQVMFRKPAKPELRYSGVRNEYVIWCPTCGYRTRPDSNKQSVIADWYLSNQPGNKHIENLWIKRYLEIREGATVVAQENENNAI